MRKFFLIFLFTGLFCFTSVSQGGLGSLFQKILRPVFELLKTSRSSDCSFCEITIGSGKVILKLKLMYKVFSKVHVAERKDIKWSLTLLKPSLSAFAVPGRYIYITRGLLQKIKTDDELAAVLGHEVGHVVAKAFDEKYQASATYQFILNKLNKRSDKLRSLGQIYSVL